jgi:molybdate transport system regulatory protein
MTIFFMISKGYAVGTGVALSTGNNKSEIFERRYAEEFHIDPGIPWRPPMNKGLSHVDGRFWMAGENGADLTAERVTLLEAIGERGSISAAAKALGMSYRSAWDAVNSINNLSDPPLLERRPGGTHGGETLLTAQGRNLIDAFRRMEAEYRRMLAGMSREIADLEHLQHLMRRLSMRSSARNQLLGTVIHTKTGPVSAEVTLAVNRDGRLTATITRESLEEMGLKEGRDAYALFKASSVIIVPPNEGLRTSARNRLCGIISRIHRGPVNSEVVISLEGDKHITATITRESEEQLGLRKGGALCALIKASHVILGVD